MAQLITRGFRLVTIIDLSSLSKGEVSMEQVSGISHDAGQEMDERKYEDSIIANIKIRKGLTGNIVIKGDIEHYVYPAYAAQTQTKPLFELDHYYLIRFLGLNVNSGVSKMLYRRWVGQLVELPKETLSAGELNEREISLAVTLYTNGSQKGYAQNAPYIATADGTPGPADATPTADYDPLFSAEVADTTKTISAAEAIISASLTNPV